MKSSFFFRRWKSLVALGLLLIIGAWAFGTPYHPIQPLPSQILDMHCHVAGIGAGDSGCFVSTKLRNSWRFKVYLRSFGVSEAELLEQGDQRVADGIAESLGESRSVSHAVLLAMDGVVNRDGILDTNRTEVYVPNSFVAEAAARHTNLLFGASIHPHRKDALEQLVRVKQQGAVLVKWIPSIMQIDPADEALIPFYKKLVELNLPLLTHTGNERSFSHSEDAYSDPERLRLPLRLGVKVIAAHTAFSGRFHGQRSAERLAGLMREFPNLTADISSLTQINKRFCLKEALQRDEFSGRLMYGSDFPLIKTLLVSPWYYSFRLPPRQILAIARTENPWDADVLLKQQLGTPTDVFARSRQLLREVPELDKGENPIEWAHSSSAHEPSPERRLQSAASGLGAVWPSAD